ncbi:MAG: RDD family protein [Desulfobacteraceae bacterium]|nr:MAG: RDD family protein [Desulfobacteraceae bacterium]
MNQTRTNSLTIQTPEGVSFALLLAGPVTRFMAWLIDLLAVIGASIVLFMIFASTGLLIFDFMRALFIILSYFAINLGYTIALEWYWHGQTLGKRLFQLRVMDAQGLQLQPSQIVIRNLLRLVDFLPGFYLLGGVTCLINRNAQRLGDVAANTIVIRIPRVSEPDLEKLLSDKFNSLKMYPHLEARLRQQVTPAEAGIALRAILRRDELEPRARVSLYREIADHFKHIVPFPPEAFDGVSDEQYIRNIIDVLFRTKPPRKELS